MGKGSKPRPFSVSNQEYADRWDAIFAKEKCPRCGSQDFEQTQGFDAQGNKVDVKECDRCEYQWDHT